MRSDNPVPATDRSPEVPNMTPYLRAIALGVVALMSFGMTQTLDLLYPAGGEVFHTGDTVVVEYTADSLYRTGAGTGTVVRISPDDGEHFYLLCPVETPDFCPTVTDEPSWGRSTFIIPDSVYSNLHLDSFGNPIGISLVSDLVYMRIHDYIDGSVADETHGPFSIVPAASSVLTVPGRPGRTIVSSESDEDTGCGGGFALALLPALLLRASSVARRKRQKQRSRIK
ncbi:MAG: hypothetical protein GF331_05430 [Chitinivibrionales bacterium]|nr:hypothetical protein [Chitinivibrionales bacterium]